MRFAVDVVWLPTAQVVRACACVSTVHQTEGADVSRSVLGRLGLLMLTVSIQPVGSPQGDMCRRGCRAGRLGLWAGHGCCAAYMCNGVLGGVASERDWARTSCDAMYGAAWPVSRDQGGVRVCRRRWAGCARQRRCTPAPRSTSYMQTAEFKFELSERLLSGCS